MQDLFFISTLLCIILHAIAVDVLASVGIMPGSSATKRLEQYHEGYCATYVLYIGLISSWVVKMDASIQSPASTGCSV